MGKLRHTLITAALVLALAGCSNEAASPPPTAAPSSPNTPTPSASTAPTPPVMPDAARAHTSEGAKAFVVYFVKVVDYTQQTLDTSLVEKYSAPTCIGCQQAIKAMKRLARRHGHFEGGAETVSGLEATPVNEGQVGHVSYDLTSEPLREVIPGVKDTFYASSTTHQFTSLLPRSEGWVVSELREVK